MSLYHLSNRSKFKDEIQVANVFNSFMRFTPHTMLIRQSGRNPTKTNKQTDRQKNNMATNSFAILNP